jgi:SAM-dependent methyltransferase
MKGVDAIGGLERQLRRQAHWLGESWRFEMSRRLGPFDSKATALDVGCGPGFVMDLLSDLLSVQGVDRDEDMVKASAARGLTATQGDARCLPFEANSFEVVYCSFLLLWSSEPRRVIEEMRRVSSEWVVCLAEPDFGGRVDYPPSLSALKEQTIDGVNGEGGDPYVGRKLRALFRSVGLDPEIGTYPGVWDSERLRSESPDEWRWIAMTSGRGPNDPEMERLRSVWDAAAADGTLFQYNPIFYAFARKR